MWLAVAAKKKFLRKNTEEMLASQPRDLGARLQLANSFDSSGASIRSLLSPK
jgi:hypothetical protein